MPLWNHLGKHQGFQVRDALRQEALRLARRDSRRCWRTPRRRALGTARPSDPRLDAATLQEPVPRVSREPPRYGSHVQVGEGRGPLDPLHPSLQQGEAPIGRGRDRRARNHPEHDEGDLRDGTASRNAWIGNPLSRLRTDQLKGTTVARLRVENEKGIRLRGGDPISRMHKDRRRQFDGRIRRLEGRGSKAGTLTNVDSASE